MKAQKLLLLQAALGQRYILAARIGHAFTTRLPRTSKSILMAIKDPVSPVHVENDAWPLTWQGKTSGWHGRERSRRGSRKRGNEKKSLVYVELRQRLMLLSGCPL